MSESRFLLTHVEFLALRSTSQGREFTAKLTRDSVWLPMTPGNEWAVEFLTGMREDDELVARAVRDLCGGSRDA